MGSLPDDSSMSDDEENFEYNVTIGETLESCRPIKQTVLMRKREEGEANNPNTKNKSKAITHNQLQIVNEKPEFRAVIDQHEDQLVKVIAKPNIYYHQLEIDYELLGSKNHNESSMSRADSPSVCAPTPEMWQLLQDQYKNSTPDFSTNFFKIFIEEKQEAHSSQSPAYGSCKFFIHVYQRKGEMKGMSLNSPVEEIVDLIHTLTQAAKTAAAKLIFSNLTCKKYEIEKLTFEGQSERVESMWQDLAWNLKIAMEHLLGCEPESADLQNLSTQKSDTIQASVSTMRNVNAEYRRELDELHSTVDKLVTTLNLGSEDKSIGNICGQLNKALNDTADQIEQLNLSIYNLNTVREYMNAMNS